MKEKVFKKYRQPSLLKSFGIMALAFLLLVSITDAASFTSGTWKGQGTYYSGMTPFDMKLTVNVQGNTFYGTLEETIYNSIVNVNGKIGDLNSFSSFEKQRLNTVINKYGSGIGKFVVFTDPSSIKPGISLNCIYYAVVNSDNSLKGIWAFPGTTSSNGDGTLTLAAISPGLKPVANFYSPSIDQLIGDGESLQIGESYQFYDQSTNNPTSWSWDFGDGTKSTLQNPSHAYNAMGGYTVTLTVKNSAGSSTTSKYCYALVDLGDVPHAAYFSANVVSGKKPLTVKFHDDKFTTEAKANLLWIDWDFGDGKTAETSVMGSTNPSLAYVSHTYKKTGVYTVTMDCRNAAGEFVATKYHYISVK